MADLENSSGQPEGASKAPTYSLEHGANGKLPGVGEMPAQTFMNGHSGISGDMSFSGNQSMGRSIDSGVSATTTAGEGSSSSYGSSMSLQSGLQHSDAYGRSASAGHNRSITESASSGHNADSNHTFSETAGVTDSASSNTGDTQSVSRTTSGGGIFLQGNYESYQGQTHFGNDGYWDRAAAADAIKQEFLSGLSQAELQKDGFQAGVHVGAVHAGDSHNAEGLPTHVSDSLVNHLVEHGYSTDEARQTVQGVSHTLAQEVNAHAMGQTGSVEFHKEGPVAVSLSNGNAASSGSTLTVSLDTLKTVHESGIPQNLDAVQTARQAPQPSPELSR